MRCLQLQLTIGRVKLRARGRHGEFERLREMEKKGEFPLGIFLDKRYTEALPLIQQDKLPRAGENDGEGGKKASQSRSKRLALGKLA